MSKPITIAVVEMPARLDATTVFTEAGALPSNEFVAKHVWLEIPEHPRPVLGVYRQNTTTDNESHWSIFNEMTDRDHLLSGAPSTQPSAWALAAENDRMSLGNPDEVLATISASS